MKEEAKILVVDDDETARKNLVRLLSREGRKVSGAAGGAAALSMVEKDGYDVILTDLIMDGMSGMEVLSRARLHDPEVEVIVVTGYASVSTAVEATRKGAFHYIEKPVRPDEVRHLVEQALEKRRLRQQVRVLESKVRTRPNEPVFICRSRRMLEGLKLIKQVARTDCNVLLTGESGTGKELAASLIHCHSARAGGRFLAINCGGFTEELLANELFGHEKDAFTGATEARPGLLESTSGGTILLDEVGDMPLNMQVKLLRAVQEQEVIRVGGNRPVRIDVRAIAATNQDLKKAVEAGLFRRDLYYRLNVVSIHIPPLRERREDIALLAGYFLARTAEKSGKTIKGFSDEAMGVLKKYSFPGNVRELESIVERAVVMARGDTIQPCDIPPDLERMEMFSFKRSDSGIKSLREIQREYIQWVLKRVGRNKTRAALLLGIDRSSLWRHLKDYEIKDR
ncbi:MAG: sigma-54 dependent transcriptional regulator [Pseudomonadota bacterium]